MADAYSLTLIAWLDFNAASKCAEEALLRRADSAIAEPEGCASIRERQRAQRGFRSWGAAPVYLPKLAKAGPRKPPTLQLQLQLSNSNSNSNSLSTFYMFYTAKNSNSHSHSHSNSNSPYTMAIQRSLLQ